MAENMKIKSVVYGLAIGDALGLPVEFHERGTFHITKMEGYGTYNQPPGTWSDDTSLTLALIEHIYEQSDLNGLMNKFVLYRKGYLTPYGKCFDIGVTTYEAIESYSSGTEPEQCGGDDEYDNGNGALMRISPIAFLQLTDFEETYKLVEKYTKITHRHPRSIVASIIYIQILIGLLQNNTLDDVFQTNPY